MELAPSTTNINTPTTKSPDQEAEIPPRIHQAKPLSFTNGVLKRHPHHHHAPPPVVVTYKECLKNHAASIGGHALDGCGEFMPSPNATHTDPTSFKCAACGCHRNFHRREPDDSPAANTTTTTIEYQPLHRHHPPPPPLPHRSPNSASPPPISSSYPSAPHMLLALSGGLSAGLNDNSPVSLPGGSSRKRFRTKFSQNQKDRMYEFAERVGWKMQKRDEEIVQEFCNEIGVDKGVLKVWMHNNKNTFAKRDPNANGNGNGNGDNNNNNLNNHHQQFENDNVGHVGTNGSSSSS